MNHGVHAVLKQTTGPMRCVFFVERRRQCIGTYSRRMDGAENPLLVVCVDDNET